MLSSRSDKGRQAEDLARKYLRGRGLDIIEANYRCPIGEIDLVCRDGGTVVFVEVRSRSGRSKGLPQESITKTKRQRLVRLAQWYLKDRKTPRTSARFDVVAVLWTEGEAKLRWIVNAFDASG